MQAAEDKSADKGADSERAWPESQTRAFLKAYIKVSAAGLHAVLRTWSACSCMLLCGTSVLTSANAFPLLCHCSNRNRACILAVLTGLHSHCCFRA